MIISVYNKGNTYVHWIIIELYGNIPNIHSLIDVMIRSLLIIYERGRDDCVETVSM